MIYSEKQNENMSLWKHANDIGCSSILRTYIRRFFSNRIVNRGLIFLRYLQDLSYDLNIKHYMNDIKATNDPYGVLLNAIDLY